MFYLLFLNWSTYLLQEKEVAEIEFEIEEASADVRQGALEGNMVSFVRYPNIKDANLNMHILQTAGIEEIVSPLMVIKSDNIWLVIERIDCTLHDYMKQLPRKWSYVNILRHNIPNKNFGGII